MKPIDVKKHLSAAIDGVADNSNDYCVNAESDFKRNRKLPFKRMVQGIIGMGGGSLTNEILDMSEYSPESASMYNFSEMITSHVVIKQKQRKHTYKANFSVAVHMCRLFYHRKITSPVLEAIISRNTIPIRPDRHRVRKNSDKSFKGFLYRIA